MLVSSAASRSMRLDTELKQNLETSSSSSANPQSFSSLSSIVEREFSQLSMNTFAYDLKPLSDKLSTLRTDSRDAPIGDYELTCRYIELNMPVVPPLKIKLTVKYPDESPEILSLTSTTLSLTPARLENSGSLFPVRRNPLASGSSFLDGHSFFEMVSRNFIYFLFKLPAQHTVTDILDIWVS